MIGFSDDKKIYTGENIEYSTDNLPIPREFPSAPSWRKYKKPPKRKDYSAGKIEYRPFKVYGDVVNAVNMAIYLRRPLLVTGDPGIGKTSLAYDIAYELQLGSVLEWPITSRTTLQDGLYHYDAIGRLNAAALDKTNEERIISIENGTQEDINTNIGDFITLGALGTALIPRHRPRLLLIDEFDKSDYDLPNDLLYIFEKGEYEIPELKRIKRRHPKILVGLHNSDAKYKVEYGKVSCAEFPLVVITSNEERELPAPFLRRCVRLNIVRPNTKQLEEIIVKHLKDMTEKDKEHTKELISRFEKLLETGPLSNDQLLNAVYLMSTHLDLGLDYEYLEANMKHLK